MQGKGEQLYTHYTITFTMDIIGYNHPRYTPVRIAAMFKKWNEVQKDEGKLYEIRSNYPNDVIECCNEMMPVSAGRKISLSARPICPGGHIFLGHSVLSDRIYCPPLGKYVRG